VPDQKISQEPQIFVLPESWWIVAAETDTSNGKISIADFYRKADSTTNLNLDANHTTPADAQVISNINFLDDSSTAVERTYGQIRSVIQSPTNAAEEGEMFFSVIDGGTPTDYISLNEVADGQVNLKVPLDMGNNNILFLDDTDIQWGGSADRKIKNTTGGFEFEIETGDDFEYVIQDTTVARLDATGLDLPVAGDKFKEEGVDISPIGLHDYYVDAGGFIHVDSESLNTRIIGATVNQKAIAYIPFTTAVTTFATAKFKLPRTYDLGTMTAVVNWMAPSGSGNVVWGISAVAVSDDEAISTAFGTEVLLTADTFTVADDSLDTARSTAITIGNTPADADTFYLKVQRRGVDAADTFTGEAQLLGVWIEITTDVAVSG
jgi:hypothetical protein